MKKRLFIVDYIRQSPVYQVKYKPFYYVTTFGYTKYTVVAKVVIWYKYNCYILQCAAWTLYTSHFQKAEWAGQCYGRGFHETTDVSEDNIVSGFVASHELGTLLTTLNLSLYLQ